MQKNYYLAIDIGASSGRHILAHQEDGHIVLEEIFRFKNNVIRKDEKMIWDIDFLIENIVIGMKKCKEINKIPVSVGIDTFGVDYVLLDEKGQRIDDVYAYRDPRTAKSSQAFNRLISAYEQYQLTGIQPHAFNTIYQLYDDILRGRIQNVTSVMLLPSYLGYYLTDVKQNEYTISSTSGMINIDTKSWDDVLLKTLSLKKEIFPDLIMPGQKIGNMRQTIQDQIGYDTTLYAVPSHDTASSVLGSLADDETIFLSSGTWSLMGVLTKTKYINPEVFEAGFTNEGSPFEENRFLKNIMGLWIIQEVVREQETTYKIEDIIEMASKSNDFSSTFNVNDHRFLSPKNMTEAIYEVLNEAEKPLPQTPGELFFCIYHSLAIEYAHTVKQIESLIGRPFKQINIVGGGSQNKILTELTRNLTQKTIISGPTESTALGNIMMQMISNHDVKDRDEAKMYIRSFIHQND